MNNIRDYIQLIEASITPSVAKRAYWHGTDNKCGQRIMKEGLRPGSEIITTKASNPKYIPAVTSGIYLTPSFTYALTFTKTTQKYSWIFNIPGDALSDIEIDEDEIGSAIRYALKYKQNPNNPDIVYARRMGIAACKLILNDGNLRDSLLSIAQTNLPDDLWRQLNEFWHLNRRWLADAGKHLLPILPDTMKQSMVDAGCHIVNRTPIVPISAWRFDPGNRNNIHNKYIETSSISKALDAFAERMR